MGIVRKFLFVLQTDLYQPALLPALTDSLRAMVEANFSPDETIKPLLSMIAANVHDGLLFNGGHHPMVF
jgi:hypothetical protein